jgi:hypothetical protein
LSQKKLTLVGALKEQMAQTKCYQKVAKKVAQIASVK